MAGFFPRRTLRGDTTGVMADFLIENSATITLGDDVDVTAGYAGLTGASARSMGVVLGFYRQLGDGQKIALSANAASGYTGTRSGNAGVIGSDTFAAASDNVTVSKVGVRVCIDPDMLYYNDSDGSLTQAMVGTYFNNVSGSDQIAASTTTTFHESNATSQWILMEWDPDNDGDASKGIFKKVKHQLVG